MTLNSIADYELLIYNLQQTFPSILSSTVHIIRMGSSSGRMIGDLFFSDDIRLNIAELFDFDDGQLDILQYGYVVWQNTERLYWYDSQAHPNDPTLASTHPHHKHVPPDIKHNRIPAPDLHFSRPNLSFLITEVENLL